jgi:signal transduction histidine kinase
MVSIRRAYAASRRWPDVVLATAVVLLDLVLFSTVLAPAPRPGDAPLGLIVGYAAAGGLALCWRRRVPVVVYAVVWAHAVGAVALPGYRPTLGLLVALYTVAAHRGARTSTAVLVAALVPTALIVADEVRMAPAGDRDATAIGVATFLVVVDCLVWMIGRQVHASRERARMLEHRREVAARKAVDAERARIARELHDIVAHSVTLMTLQAAGARGVMRHDPDRAERSLLEVGSLGTQAMAELRRLLTVLRPGEAIGADGQAHRGLADVPDLVAAVARAGVDASLRCEGEQHPLDPSVATTAYRVVQEALTNVVKHAGPGAGATVLLAWSEDSLLVEATDDGCGESSDPSRSLSTGHGLLGLRERVGVVGGALHAGPVDGGGFRVSATLPVAAVGADRLALGVEEVDSGVYPSHAGR